MIQRVRILSWTPPLHVATGLVAHDGALCLLSDPAVPGSRSFVAADPDRVHVRDRVEEPLFEALRDDAMATCVVGLAAYDAGARVATGQRTSVWPDLILARYPSILVFDHDANQLSAVGLGEDEAAVEAALDRAESWLESACVPIIGGPVAMTFDAEAPAEAYRTSVADVVARIGAGDLFQANIARAWTGALHPTADPFDVFLRLSAEGRDRASDGSAPYGAFWRLGDRAVVSNSPELFLTADFDTLRLETRPIKGTRPRDVDPVEDAVQVRDLIDSAKDRAENLMIVDLMRNDLSRVSQPGSVRVDRLFEIESHATVHHLVSTVSGEMVADVGVADVLEATFPPGSITGAPKHQAMKVIADLEPPRGAWCGSLFVVDPNGNLTASVLIRTATFQRCDDVWTFRALAGAGIVADSDPEAELAETEVKISALRKALIG